MTGGSSGSGSRTVAAFPSPSPESAFRVVRPSSSRRAAGRLLSSSRSGTEVGQQLRIPAIGGLVRRARRLVGLARVATILVVRRARVSSVASGSDVRSPPDGADRESPVGRPRTRRRVEPAGLAEEPLEQLDATSSASAAAGSAGCSSVSRSDCSSAHLRRSSARGVRPCPPRRPRQRAWTPRRSRRRTPASRAV